MLQDSVQIFLVTVFIYEEQNMNSVLYVVHVFKRHFNVCIYILLNTQG